MSEDDVRVVGTPQPPERRSFYPPVEPDETGRLNVGDGHVVHWELCGDPQSVPAVFLHGGPGGGCSVRDRRLFDPRRYRVLLFDQRGCGRSTPTGELAANTTWHLVSDMERLREMLGFTRWLVFGGSWGATLALAYAEAYPARVSGMILRGVFAGRPGEVRWLFQEGASALFPEKWERFAALVSECDPGDVLRAYRRLLTAPERAVRLVAAKAWCRWEQEISTLLPADPHAAHVMDDDALLTLAEISCHYFAHDCFLGEDQLLRQAHRLAAIPGIIVQGRYDLVTPVRTAFELNKAWPSSDLVVVSDAGHASGDSALLHHLIAATDDFAERIAASPHTRRG